MTYSRSYAPYIHSVMYLYPALPYFVLMSAKHPWIHITLPGVHIWNAGMEGAGVVPWVGGPLDASFGFYIREAFQSQTNTEKRESLGTDIL